MSADGTAPEARRFLLGVNYWPRSSAMAMWSRFDAGEIDEDFARIAALGLDVVRFFLLWEVFQPQPDLMDSSACRNFEAVLACAERHRLLTMPTLFTGHMSGVNWLPAWTLDKRAPAGRFRTISGGRERQHGIGDFYCGELLRAQMLFVKSIGERARGQGTVLAWDLGNEFSNLRIPATAADAATWSRALAATLTTESGLPVTGGIHGEDLTQDRNLRPSSVCAPWPFATMHGYPAYSAFARDTADAEVVPFLASLTRSFSDREVLFSEFGNPACPPASASASTMPCLHEEAMALYATAVLERLHARGALGAFWWCWTDYASELAPTPPFDLAPHELYFGVVRADRSEKPVAKALADFARRKPMVQAISDTWTLAEDTYYATLPASTESTYRAYLRSHEVAPVNR